MTIGTASAVLSAVSGLEARKRLAPENPNDPQFE